jgi:molybdenum cofactor cytidylyltransferase
MIEAIVLAAGASSRMGRPKAALPLLNGRETFLSRLCGTLLDAGLPRVTIVTGAVPDVVSSAWPDADPRVRIAHNPDWSLGQLSSILAGLAAVDERQTDALVVALVDVPLVRASTVRALVEAWRTTRAPIVRPSRNGQHGHPVVFDRAIFHELRAADPAHGAKPIVHAHLDTLVDYAIDDDGAFRDADTEDEYQRLLALEALRRI